VRIFALLELQRGIKAAEAAAENEDTCFVCHMDWSGERPNAYIRGVVAGIADAGPSIRAVVFSIADAAGLFALAGITDPGYNTLRSRRSNSPNDHA
jgi:hypothetical protein